MNFINRYFPSILILISLCLLCSCGGGSSDSGMLIEGTLVQGAAVHHLAVRNFRHGESEPIGEVQICALGECSTTSETGQWGFVAVEGFTGGDIAFSIIGHGIDATTIVTIPDGAQSVDILFEHSTGNDVSAKELTVDGATVSTGTEE